MTGEERRMLIEASNLAEFNKERFDRHFPELRNEIKAMGGKLDAIGHAMHSMETRLIEQITANKIEYLKDGKESFKEQAKNAGAGFLGGGVILTIVELWSRFKGHN